MAQRVVGHPAISPSAMAQAKTTIVLKRDASNAKEALLQCAMAAYQEALASNEVLSVHEAALALQCAKNFTPGVHKWMNIYS